MSRRRVCYTAFLTGLFMHAFTRHKRSKNREKKRPLTEAQRRFIDEFACFLIFQHWKQSTSQKRRKTEHRHDVPTFGLQSLTSAFTRCSEPLMRISCPLDGVFSQARTLALVASVDQVETSRTIVPRSPSPKESAKLIVVIHKGILSAHASDEME